MSPQGKFGLILLAGLCALDASAGMAAPAPQTMTFGGPMIPGLCVLNQQAIFASAKVGVAANAQYKQMRDAAQNGVNAEEARIKADAAALQKQKLAPAQLQQRQQQLAKRQEDLRGKAAKESQGLEAARRNAVTKIAAIAQPIIKQVYDQKKCGLLLARTAILAGNGGMDITVAVIQALDSKVSSIKLDKQVAARK